MPVPPISQLPVAPQVSDTPSVFSARANTFVAALSTLVTETNATVEEINAAVAGNLVQFDGFKGVWEAGTFDAGDLVFYAPTQSFFISLEDGNDDEPPAGDWQQIGDALSTSYDNTASGLDATNVQAAIDEVSQAGNIRYENTESGLAATHVQAAIDEVADKQKIASTAQAQAGADNETFITPLRMREGFNASGSAPVFACRAWVNFNGEQTAPTIRASGNVSSVTRNGDGDYTVNFTNAMPDNNYSVSAWAATGGATGRYVSAQANHTFTTSAVRIITVTDGGSVISSFRVCVAIFR